MELGLVEFVLLARVIHRRGDDERAGGILWQGELATP